MDTPLVILTAANAVESFSRPLKVENICIAKCFFYFHNFIFILFFLFILFF